MSEAAKKSCSVQLPAAGAGLARSEKFVISDTIVSSIRFAFDLDDDALFMLRDPNGALLAAHATNLSDGVSYTLQVRAARAHAEEKKAAGTPLPERYEFGCSSIWVIWGCQV